MLKAGNGIPGPIGIFVHLRPPDLPGTEQAPAGQGSPPLPWCGQDRAGVAPHIALRGEGAVVSGLHRPGVRGRARRGNTRWGIYCLKHRPSYYVLLSFCQESFWLEEVFLFWRSPQKTSTLVIPLTVWGISTLSARGGRARKLSSKYLGGKCWRTKLMKMTISLLDFLNQPPNPSNLNRSLTLWARTSVATCTTSCSTRSVTVSSSSARGASPCQGSPNGRRLCWGRWRQCFKRWLPGRPT